MGYLRQFRPYAYHYRWSDVQNIGAVVPTYEVQGDKVLVKVNHVMEDEHYIDWVAMVSDEKECIKYFKPGEIAETHFKYIPGSVLYAYCNKHGLWKKEVE